MQRVASTSILALVLAVPVALSGCVTELLTEEAVTVRTFACAFLDPDDERPVFLDLHRERGVPRVAVTPMEVLAEHLEASGFGPAWRHQAREGDLLEGEGPWSREALQEWALEAEVLAKDAVHLHVLWVSGFTEELTTLQVAPGVVAVNETAVQAGAGKLARSETFLARVFLWHAVGHALGTVNEGIPLNGTDPAVQEGTPGHEPSPESIMHHGWDRLATLPRTDATYDAYSKEVLDDWRAAVGPEGVCP